MVIGYDIETGKILTANYGQDAAWDQERIDLEKTRYPTNNYIILPNEEIGMKYYDEDTQSIKTMQEFSIQRNREGITNNGTDKIRFSNIPPGTKFYIDDGGTPEEMDESGILDFSAEDSGNYFIVFKKKGYEWSKVYISVHEGNI